VRHKGAVYTHTNTVLVLTTEQHIPSFFAETQFSTRQWDVWQGSLHGSTTIPCTVRQWLQSVSALSLVQRCAIAGDDMLVCAIRTECYLHQRCVVFYTRNFCCVRISLNTKTDISISYFDARSVYTDTTSNYVSRSEGRTKSQYEDWQQLHWKSGRVQIFGSNVNK